MALRGAAWTAIGEGIGEAGKQVGGFLEKREEEKRLQPLRNIQKRLGEQQLLQGEKKLTAQDAAIAEAERINRNWNKLTELLQDKTMQQKLTEIGKDPAQTQGAFDKLGVSTDVAAGKEPISMEGLQATQQKVEAVPSSYEEQLARVREKMPKAEFEQDPRFKAVFAKEKEIEKVAGQRGFKREIAETKLGGQFDLEKMNKKIESNCRRLKTKLKLSRIRLIQQSQVLRLQI